jgi:hypothetical protein
VGGESFFVVECANRVRDADAHAGIGLIGRSDEGIEGSRCVDAAQSADGFLAHADEGIAV